MSYNNIPIYKAPILRVFERIIAIPDTLDTDTYGLTKIGTITELDPSSFREWDGIKSTDLRIIKIHDRETEPTNNALQKLYQITLEDNKSKGYMTFNIPIIPDTDIIDNIFYLDDDTPIKIGTEPHIRNDWGHTRIHNPKEQNSYEKEMQFTEIGTITLPNKTEKHNWVYITGEQTFEDETSRIYLAERESDLKRLIIPTCKNCPLKE